jgi:hypothetical protein
MNFDMKILSRRLNNKLIVKNLAYRQLHLKNILKILRIIGIIFSFLLMVGLALVYELKQSFRWVFFGVPPE